MSYWQGQTFKLGLKPNKKRGSRQRAFFKRLLQIIMLNKVQIGAATPITAKGPFGGEGVFRSQSPLVV